MNMHITMETQAENYLNERRRLGFGLRNPGYAVTSFARYIDASKVRKIFDFDFNI